MGTDINRCSMMQVEKFQSSIRCLGKSVSGSVGTTHALISSVCSLQGVENFVVLKTTSVTVICYDNFRKLMHIKGQEDETQASFQKSCCREESKVNHLKCYQKKTIKLKSTIVKLCLKSC